jgi:hypothetical protein
MAERKTGPEKQWAESGGVAHIVKNMENIIKLMN